VRKPNKITLNVGGGGLMLTEVQTWFVRGNRPAIVAKLSLQKRKKNQIRETLEKLQKKGGKSKAAK
jgi:translation initiation factor IF-2